MNTTTKANFLNELKIQSDTKHPLVTIVIMIQAIFKYVSNSSFESILTIKRKVKTLDTMNNKIKLHIICDFANFEV